jgi:penicillin-binding protein 1A
VSTEPPLQPIGKLLDTRPPAPRPARASLQTAPNDPTKRTRPRRSPPRSKLQRILRRTVRWTVRIVLSLIALGLGGALVAWLVIRHFEAELPDVTDLSANYHPSQVTRVLARDGSVLTELFTERRTVVALDDLPAHVKLAILAAEDANFYNELDGLNYWGIARAALVNLRAGHTRQGASTITQQVVKVMLLDPERTYSRKIREALLARKIERALGKDKILELYINQVNFGHGRYGIEEAARYNFGKSAKNLTIAEAAMLAGLLPGPEIYSPHKDMQKALMRRSYVLGQMHEKGWLDDARFAQADQEKVNLATGTDDNPELCPEIVDYVRKMLKEIDPDRAAKGGFVVTTTIDPKLQAAARKAVRDDLEAFDKKHGWQGAHKGTLPPPVAPTFGGPVALQPRGKNGKPLKVAAVKKPPAPPGPTPFEGTPTFEGHKAYGGVVVGADDTAGTFDVRVGTVVGVVKIADYERYNPEHLLASVFAPPGARFRVSLLAPVPDDGTTKVPLRIEDGPEAAMVAIDNRTRNVLALVGSYESLSGGLDRALQSKRQPGSTFKPIVYSYALHSRRYTPATLVDVNPATFAGGYSPSNYEGWTGHDPVRLREALANSINVVAVRVLDDVGPENVVPWAHALGITSTLKPDLSLALGSYEVAPIELAAAYATFASGGRYEEPRLVTRIQGPDGKDLELPPPPPPRVALDEAEAYVMTSMLESVVDHGTAAKARELHRPLAGKTGTSNGSKDTWFAGYSTEVTAVVWVGNDDGKPMGGGETGASTALPAWISFMKAAHERKPPSEFPRPDGVVAVRIDRHSGKLPPEGDTDTMDEVFLAGTEPTEVADDTDGGAGGATPTNSGADGGSP